MFSEIGLHFVFLGQMIYGCVQQSGMNTRKQMFVLHKTSLPCNNIHSTHTHSLNTHPLTNKANSIWGGNVLDFGLLEFTLQLVSLSEVNGSYAKNLAP